MTKIAAIDLNHLVEQIKTWGRELGFQQVAITDANLGRHEAHLQAWLAEDYHGDMDYMERHGSMRSHPNELVPGTLRVISARMDYLPADTETSKLLKQGDKAYISRYALGRDYHKLIRKRLAKIAKKIEGEIGPFGYRAFVDSAPVLERALAEKAGLGWIGKNTMLLNRKAGSWFFLGEIYVDIALPTEPVAEKDHCGRCTACLDICPTQAFVGAKILDARKCISYLTIESKTAIPEELRALIGNRIYGCDDCQLVCPWNRFAKPTQEKDFQPRHSLDNTDLLSLFAWDEQSFLKNTEGSPIRRIGHEAWLRNIAVALGNAPYSKGIIKALTEKLSFPSSLVQEHAAWALQRQQEKAV